MLRFGVVALQPELIAPLARQGVVGRAFERGLAQWQAFNPREWADDPHRTVDDRSYGGGPGMVLKFAPAAAAIREALSWLAPGSRRIALTADGRRFDQALAGELAAAPGVLLVAGRYEGLDERLFEAFELTRVSLGDYVLSGGELAAAVVMDASVRLLPGVLGDAESALQESFQAGLLDHPHYTRPEEIEGRIVPPVLLGGNHEAIRRWRLKQALGRTWRWRPDLLAHRSLSAEEAQLLTEYQRETEVVPHRGNEGREAGKG